MLSLNTYYIYLKALSLYLDAYLLSFDSHSSSFKSCQKSPQYLSAICQTMSQDTRGGLLTGQIPSSLVHGSHHTPQLLLPHQVPRHSNLASIHLAVSRLQVFWPRALLIAPGSQSEGPSALLFAPGNQSDGPAPQLFSPACLRQISPSAFVPNLFQLTVLDPNLDFSTPSNNSATPFARPPHFNLNKAELRKANSYGRRGL